MKNSTNATVLAAVKTMSPIIAGFIPTAVAYGLLCIAAGINPYHVILSSLLVYAGSAQFISIELIKLHMGLLQYGLIIFLINFRHIFYGISVFDKYSTAGKAKPFMIFWLTDEAYAVLTGTKTPAGVKAELYYFCVTFLGYTAWSIGTALGVFASQYVRFDITGMDFALTAMFLAILTEQFLAFKNKLPFVIGGATAVVSLITLGPRSMLLGCATGSAILLLLTRNFIEKQNTPHKE